MSHLFEPLALRGITLPNRIAVLRAARELGQLRPWPAQYLRAAPTGSPAYLSEK